MSRLIDADALIHELNNSRYPGAPYVDAGISIAIGKVCDAQTIEPERQKGKWIALKHSHNAMCSKCYQTFVDAYDLENWDNYCRHCGAVMESIVAEEEWDE